MRGALTASLAEIVANEPVAREHHVIALTAPEIASAATPGQFAMLRVPVSYDPLLPRAFSFYRLDPAAGRVEFLYRVVGKGTRLLADQRPRALLQIWGPLGRGFERPPGPAILIGGGVGVPPLVCLAEHARRHEWLTHHPIHPVHPVKASVVPQSPIRNPPVLACFGFATSAFVVGEEPLAAAGVPLQIATDDGTRGHHGFVTDLLRDILNAQARSPKSATRNPKSEIQAPTVYACGPHGMLAAVARLCLQWGVPSQLALEAPMACGVGACIGCTVPRREGGYARVCTDGPVFHAEDIDW